MPPLLPAKLVIHTGSVFDMIEIAVRGHDVAATIAPFRRARDGCGALLALKSQHARKAIYDQLVKEAENVLKNRHYFYYPPATHGVAVEGVVHYPF